MTASVSTWKTAKFALIAGAFASTLATPALADIVVLTGLDNTASENVLLDSGALDNAVSGVGDTTGGRITFTGQEALTTDTLPLRIVAGDGSFSVLTITPTDVSNLLTRFVINLNALTDGNVTLTVREAHGFDFVDTFFVDGNGQNPFTITAINGQLITSIEFSGVALADARQLRAGFAGLPPTIPIPEPAAWTLMIGGLAAAGLGLRRRRSITSPII